MSKQDIIQRVNHYSQPHQSAEVTIVRGERLYAAMMVGGIFRFAPRRVTRLHTLTMGF